MVAWFLLGWSMIYAWIGSVEIFIGIVLVVIELVLTRRWNKRVGILKTHEKLTLQEAADKTGTTPDKTRSLIYEALSLGELSGRFDGETFTQS